MQGRELQARDPALAAVDAFRAALDAPARAVLDAALTELSAAVHGALPPPEVRGDALVWEVPEGGVELRITHGVLDWRGEYGDDFGFGSTVHVDPDGPEALFRLGLVHFMARVLARRTALHALRDALLKELRAAADPAAVLAYLSGGTTTVAALDKPKP